MTKKYLQEAQTLKLGEGGETAEEWELGNGQNAGKQKNWKCMGGGQNNGQLRGQNEQKNGKRQNTMGREGSRMS
jgi:hypothetical protein